MQHRKIVACGVVLSLLTGVLTAQTEQSMECEAVLIHYEARALYGETVRVGDSIAIADFSAPMATFMLEAPERFAGRTVKVVFLATTSDEAISVSNDDLGERFKLELSEKYFAEPDGWAIRHTLVVSMAKVRSDDRESQD